MNIEIKVAEEQKNLNQSQLQVIRRMIGVLNERDFSVTLTFTNEAEHNNHDVYTTRFMGGSYPTVGTHVQIRKTQQEYRM
jgi:uncharacterized protein (UPF0276 family)